MIGIIVLSYNNWSDTGRCIESIFASAGDFGYHVFLVDNASTSPVTPELADILLDGRITYVRSICNEGYSSGNNQGISAAIEYGCKEILIVNNDVVFKKNSIYQLYSYLRSHDDVGIVGPKVLLGSGHLQEINMGVKTGLRERYMFLLRKTFLSYFVREFISNYCALDKDLASPFEVHSVSGCCFMISARCVEHVTPLDENVFLYLEELIIGVKAEKAGFRTVYLTNSEVVHLHEQTTKRMRAFSFTCLVESEIYYLRRYMDSPRLYLVPLYLLRTMQYVSKSFSDQEFMNNMRCYFGRTLRRLRQVY